MKVLSSSALELLFIFSSSIVFWTHGPCGIFCFLGVGVGVSAMSLVLVMTFFFNSMAWPTIKCIVRFFMLCHPRVLLILRSLLWPIFSRQ